MSFNLKKKTILFGGTLLILLIVLLAIYGKQAYTLLFVHYNFRDKMAFLNLQPEERDINIVNLKIGYEYNMFGCKLNLPFNNEPKMIETEISKQIYVPDEFLFSIIKPNFDYLEHIHNIKIGNEFKNLADFNKAFSTDFNNGFDFVQASFYARPSIEYLFKSKDEADLLLYKVATKWSHIKMGKISLKILSFKTDHFRGFQIGDPQNSEVVVLWLYPDSGAEYEIHLASKNGFLKQEHIDGVLSSIIFEDNAK